MTTIKRLLLILLILSFAGYFYYSAGNKTKTNGNITFYITNDIHFLANELTDNGEAFQKFFKSGSRMQLDYIEEIVDAFAYNIKNKKPDFLIISGDLTTNGEKKSHLKLSQKLKNIEKDGTSVYVIPGNHDILNPYARKFKGNKQFKTDYINDKDFEDIYKNFGFNEAISRDEASLSYLVAPSNDIWLLMLDTAQYKDNLTLGLPQGDGMIRPETLEWIKNSADLAKESDAEIIVVMHHNLLDHSNKVNKGYTLNNNNDAIEVFRKSGIDLVLTGHIHQQDIKSLKIEEETIYDISTSALSVYPQKYGVLKYSPSGIYDYRTSIIDVESWSKEMGIKEENLNNFKEYSQSFVGSDLYNRYYFRLQQIGGYSDEEVELMAKTSKLIRLRYLEGNKKVLTDEILNSEGFNLLRKIKSGSFYESIMGMAYGDISTNNELSISKVEQVTTSKSKWFNRMENN